MNSVWEGVGVIFLNIEPTHLRRHSLRKDGVFFFFFFDS